jgi:hypothetical protein
LKLVYRGNEPLMVLVIFAIVQLKDLLLIITVVISLNVIIVKDNLFGGIAGAAPGK